MTHQRSTGYLPEPSAGVTVVQFPLLDLGTQGWEVYLCISLVSNEPLQGKLITRSRRLDGYEPVQYISFSGKL